MAKKYEKIGSKMSECRNRLDILYNVIQDGIDILNINEIALDNLDRMRKPGDIEKCFGDFGPYFQSKSQAKNAIQANILSGKEELYCQKSEVFELLDQIKEIYNSIEKDLKNNSDSDKPEKE